MISQKLQDAIAGVSDKVDVVIAYQQGFDKLHATPCFMTTPEEIKNCLLYTSDAADDLLCVDIGGRRIIKKKNKTKTNTNKHVKIHKKNKQHNTTQRQNCNPNS